MSKHVNVGDVVFYRGPRLAYNTAGFSLDYGERVEVLFLSPRHAVVSNQGFERNPGNWRGEVLQDHLVKSRPRKK